MPEHRSYQEFFIGGHWRKPASGEQLTVISPHSGEPIGAAPAAGPADVDAAVSAARTAFDDGPWPRLDPRERMRKIEELATIYAGHIDEMADLITAEMGSPRSFSRLGPPPSAASSSNVSAWNWAASRPQSSSTTPTSTRRSRP